ncbi:ABC transporter substrate-binding protein [Kitasatospora saccharophila]|uniref:ABC transporter substrate-binding protein n=1 Tax=Kitasatospora saccharophila TaxID=407973 RepID=A0ABP5JGA6_9ACTN
MHSRRTRLTTVLVAALAVSGTACAGGGTGDEPHGTITWYASRFGPADVDMRETLIEEFQKAYPRIHVLIADAPSDTDAARAAIAESVANGSDSFDVYNGDVVWPTRLGEAGLALPLNEHFDADFWASFDPALLNSLQYQGKIMAAPLFADHAFLFYRKDLLEKAGLPAPTTWEQLQQEAERLQKAGLVKYGFAAQWAGYEGLTCGWTEFAADAGGSSIDAGGTTAQVDSPENLKALTYMKGLIDEGVAPEDITGFKEDEAQALFTSGQVAFLRNWAYAYTNAQESPLSKVSGKVGVVSLPAFQGQNGGGRTTAGGWNLYVSPHGTHLAASLTFVRWITGPEAQKTLAIKGGMLPARKGVLNDADVQAVNPVFRAAAANRPVTRPTWTTADYAKVSATLYTNVNAALTGATTPAKALKAAQHDLSGVLAAKP